MMKIRSLSRFLRLPIVANLPTLEVDGNLIPAGSLTAYLGGLVGASTFANANFSTVTNVTTGALALTPANCAQGIVNAIVVASGGSANTVTTDTATAIINTYWANGAVGSRAVLLYVNNNSGTTTLAGGTGVTLSGTATIPTLALAYYGLTITNLANPSVTGAVSTNSTTTTAAVAIGSSAGVIPVTASTGMLVNGYLKWVNTDGTFSQSRITAINTLNITVADNITKPIASGAAVTVFNNTLTMLRLFSTVTATTAA